MSSFRNRCSVPLFIRIFLFISKEAVQGQILISKKAFEPLLRKSAPAKRLFTDQYFKLLSDVNIKTKKKEIYVVNYSHSSFF